MKAGWTFRPRPPHTHDDDLDSASPASKHRQTTQRKCGHRSRLGDGSRNEVLVASEVVHVQLTNRAVEATTAVSTQIALGRKEAAERLVREVVMVRTVDVRRNLDIPGRIADRRERNRKFDTGHDRLGRGLVGRVGATQDARNIAVVEGHSDAEERQSIAVRSSQRSGKDVSGGLKLRSASNTREVDVESVATKEAVPHDDHVIGLKARVKRESRVLRRPVVIARVITAVSDAVGEHILATRHRIDEDVELVKVALKVAGEHQIQGVVVNLRPATIQFAEVVAELGLDGLQGSKIVATVSGSVKNWLRHRSSGKTDQRQSR